MKPLYQDLPFTPASYVNVYKEELPHFIVPWHYHPEIEIMYILEGTGTRFVGDHVEKYSEGDICMVGGNLPPPMNGEMMISFSTKNQISVRHAIVSSL